MLFLLLFSLLLLFSVTKSTSNLASFSSAPPVGELIRGTGANSQVVVTEPRVMRSTSVGPQLGWRNIGKIWKVIDAGHPCGNTIPNRENKPQVCIFLKRPVATIVTTSRFHGNLQYDHPQMQHKNTIYLSSLIC